MVKGPSINQGRFNHGLCFMLKSSMFFTLLVCFVTFPSRIECYLLVKERDDVRHKDFEVMNYGNHSNVANKQAAVPSIRIAVDIGSNEQRDTCQRL